MKNLNYGNSESNDSSIYLTELYIEKVRHLKDISITLSGEEKKHLILTGKNGSGKTSVLELMAFYIKNHKWYKDGMLQYAMESKAFQCEMSNEDDSFYNQTISMKFNQGQETIRNAFITGNTIFAYYKANRILESIKPRHIEKMNFKTFYEIDEMPREEFVKYLLDLKMTQALANTNGKKEKAEQIVQWFDKFDDLLKKVFGDPSTKLEFNDDTFEFYIQQDGRELFDFNTMSSGYSAVFDIVLDIMMRMESRNKNKFLFNMPGIVLIDELESHLHIELQRCILDMLTSIFPNIQFIVTTHSPFVLNSREDVIIYDLENHILVENGLVNIPYQGIVEGYFGADTLSEKLRQKYERYKELTTKKDLTDEDFVEMAKLEIFLDEIPDYLALGIATEYQKLKMDFEEREDIE